jgi:chemotaxis regulatin CheY-phosphate phosphatase CheZ
VAQAEKRKDRLKRLYLVRLPRPVETQSPQQQALEEKQKELADEWSGLNRKIDKTKVIRAS